MFSKNWWMSPRLFVVWRQAFILTNTAMPPRYGMCMNKKVVSSMSMRQGAFYHNDGAAIALGDSNVFVLEQNVNVPRRRTFHIEVKAVFCNCLVSWISETQHKLDKQLKDPSKVGSFFVGFLIGTLKRFGPNRELCGIIQDLLGWEQRAPSESDHEAVFNIGMFIAFSFVD